MFIITVIKHIGNLLFRGEFFSIVFASKIGVVFDMYGVIIGLQVLKSCSLTDTTFFCIIGKVQSEKSFLCLELL